MATTDFIDSIRVFVRSGKGGAGSAHFHRSKLVAKGGPDGGDGGRGGHIILEGNENLWTLHHLRYRKHLLAPNGANGSSNKCSGKIGTDLIIQVPLGTLAIDEETATVEIEITKHGQRAVWIKGGKGGLGNVHFATSTRKSPTYAQPGLPGVEGWKKLELKILADVGLVGFPNAGKSTLLSSISAAKPKIANYPFTTLTPQLGIISLDESQTFCMADLPGIIEGAWEGKGLGHRFLRHIERNAVLAFVISLESENPQQEFEILYNELKRFNPLMATKAFVVILTKTDIITDETHIQQASNYFKSKAIDFYIISAVSQQGIKKLTTSLWQKIASIND